MYTHWTRNCWNRVIRIRSKGKMSILWEKSGTWRWMVRKTRDSKPFFLAFATVCGVVPGVIGFCVMQLTSSRNPDLEAKLRQSARPESLVSSDPHRTLTYLSFWRIRIPFFPCPCRTFHNFSVILEVTYIAEEPTLSKVEIWLILTYYISMHRIWFYALWRSQLHPFQMVYYPMIKMNNSNVS